MFSKISHQLKNLSSLFSRKTLIATFSILSIVGYGAFVFAVAPPGGYLPGQTLNPDCGPLDNDPNCFVQIVSNGVTSINGITGQANIIAGKNTSIDRDGNNISISANFNETGKYIISGGAVWSGSGFTYDVSIVSYFFNGLKEGNQETVTLDPSDNTYDRIDAFVITEGGDIYVIKGTPSANPASPVIDDDELLIQLVIVPAGATEPGIISETIYNENTEWTSDIKKKGNAASDIGTIDFNNTNYVKKDNRSMFWNANEASVVSFLRGSSFEVNDWTSLNFWIRLEEPITDGRRFEFRFYKNAGTAVGNYVDIRTMGLNRTLLHEWQLITIPISAFNIPQGQLADRLRMTFTLGSPDTVRNLYIDNIRLTTDGTPKQQEQTNPMNISVNGSVVGSGNKLNLIAGDGINLEGSLDDGSGQMNVLIDTDLLANNGLTAVGNSFQLGGTLTSDTFINSNNKTFTIGNELSNGGNYFIQMSNNSFGMPGVGMGTTLADGSVARSVMVQNNDILVTYLGSADSNEYNNYTVSTIYDPSTKDGNIELLARKEGVETIFKIKSDGWYFNGQGALFMNSQTGLAGQVLTSNGSGAAPTWETVSGGSSPISVNGTTLYSSGLIGTGNTNGNNIFFGASAGSGATGASYSNFLGHSAGNGATSASFSNFLGPAAGSGATGASHSNFLGYSAGNGATGAFFSNFLGYQAGSGATDASNSNFLGRQAGYNATSANNSNFFGQGAGSGAVDAYESNFSGYQAGMGATGSYYSNFFGRHAGYQAIDSYDSNFFGTGAGYQAVNVDRSNFFGNNSGYKSSGAINSNFFGYTAGALSGGASNSNFFGYQTGYNATSASNSNFFGPFAGYNAPNASNSIFIGQNSGYNDTVNNTGDLNDFSILLGPNTSTGGFSNSIALGGSATNTATNQFMIGSAARPINDLTIVGTGFASCTIDIPGGTDAGGGTGTGISCSSDERLKTNIENLESTTLDTLLNVKTVRYNWSANPTGNKSIGFLAQDLQQYFPELIKTGHDGYLQVNYGGMTPILVKAIQEMNLRITDLNNMTEVNPWRDGLIAWLGNASNKITRIFTGELCLYSEDGDTECINMAELRALKRGQSLGSTTITPATPTTPVEPTVPTEPVTPVDPTNPVDPITPPEVPVVTPPVAPSEPTAPVEPSPESPAGNDGNGAADTNSPSANDGATSGDTSSQG